jgi:N-acetylmuramoyl-L-alanine amidase
MSDTKSSRRSVLGALAATTATLCCGDHVASAAIRSLGAPDPSPQLSPVTDRSTLVKIADGLSIHPRTDWGADLPPRRSMGVEDVRFLLVHHSATANSLTDARQIIRSIYAFHTSSEKGWPDVAYNFFVAADGTVWEGRAGSLDGPVVADATGGNQGFSQLVCLLGNHVDVAPSPVAQASLVQLLAWLAGRHNLGTYARASTTFVSRGSNKFAAGTSITTPTISAHRDVTYTTCPGDAAVALLDDWRRQVFTTLSATWTTTGLQRAGRQVLAAP